LYSTITGFEVKAFSISSLLRMSKAFPVEQAIMSSSTLRRMLWLNALLSSQKEKYHSLKSLDAITEQTQKALSIV